MSRLAWFTPWPPQPSGIAGRSAELVPLLASRGHAIDVFVDERRVPAARAASGAPEPGAVRVQSAHEFVWRQARGQYDLAVYQVGNSELHEFLWPYLFHWPGLVVLHDARLHHARGRALLSAGRDADYRAEFAWNHPHVAIDAAELAVHGFDGIYYYQWPMRRAIVRSARLVAAHARGAAARLQAEFPDRPVEYVALGEGRPTPVAPEACRAFRAAHRLPDEAVVFGIFGAITAEKRVRQALRAFAASCGRTGPAHLLLAGAVDPHLDVPGLVAGLGLSAVTHVAGPLDAERFDVAIAASDVCLNLRWPTALETSGPWLRALAASRATVVVDLAHLAPVPTLDPRTWHPHEPRDRTADADAAAVTVSIDLLDEDHSLRLALQRLAVDQALRDRLGAAGRRYWEAEHTVERMVDDYDRVLARALAAPQPRAPVPAHLRPDPLAHTRAVLDPVTDADVVRHLAALDADARP
jgi:glycosyltransferase involved in cell wall biosynthesis